MRNMKREINDFCNPIKFESEKVCVTSDWHIPYVDDNLYAGLLKVGNSDYGNIDLVIAGDFLDTESYSRFTPMAPGSAFFEEVQQGRDYLEEIIPMFKHTYICRGNHEKRLIDMNAGKLSMHDIVHMMIPEDMSKREFGVKVTVTQDDHLRFTQDGKPWMCAHPRNFRIINLSVARDLAARYQTNVVVAHGHQMAMGWDRSGTYRLVDGGGLFDKMQLSYLRETTCYPETKNGFIIVKDNKVTVMESQ